MKMNPRALLLLLSSLMLVTAGCEDSDVTAPSGSTVTLIAQPASVFIDQTQGQLEGSTLLVAQVTDANGLPLADIPVFFTTTTGLLASITNRCISGACTLTADLCANDAQCPAADTPSIKTDNSGIATDTLTLRLFEDDDMATVTVKGTNLEQRVEIAKNVNTGPIDAVPNIVPTPTGGQRTGLPFTFDGTTSTHDPQVEIECYNWELFSSKKVFDANSSGCVECPVPGSVLCSQSCESRSTNNGILALSIGQVGDSSLDQDIAVILRVSDDPSIVCQNGMPVDEDLFSPVQDTLIYPIRCDVTAPFVEAGGNQGGSLSANGGTVSLSLTAIASDLEDTVLAYSWQCGNGQGAASQTVVCNYTSQGTFQATVTVTNDCGLTSQDSLVVSIDP